ncbi:DUF4383 domain-containing protein [Streptomyces sp. NPDC007872]|uniref:DUF4383 domain-containing protein n=1 Tax=Streptomyces sp. NPDC007872 TaxID=3364782 RepID=UPI003675D754
MKLREELPVDHRLATVHRVGAATCGVILIVFGCLGFASALDSFDTSGERIAGMTSNTALSVISDVVGIALITGAVVGGNFASTLNMTVGSLFVLSGFYHPFTLEKPANFLDFGMTNVMFSFLIGLLVLIFGMYGRVSGRLPHDNPCWKRRHPREAARESIARRREACVEKVVTTPSARPGPLGSSGSGSGGGTRKRLPGR